MALDPIQLIAMRERLMADHQLWRPIWQDLSDYILPKRSHFVTQRQQGAKQTEKLFDSTALDASDRLASTINGTLTSRAVQWFSLKTRDDETNEVQEVKEYLDDCAKRMFRAFNQSNFGQEIAEDYLDLVSLGTGAIFMEERNPHKPAFGGFVFTCLALSDYAIDENAEGSVDTIARDFKLSAAAAVRYWGREKCSKRINKAIEDGKPETTFTFAQLVFPRAPKLAKLGSPLTLLPFVSAYVCLDDKELITESGYEEFPCMVARWSKTSGEKYGRGPGFLALPDIKTLNKIKEKVLKAAAKAVDPPTKSVAEMVVGTIRSTGGGNTVVRGDIDNIQPLFPAGYFAEIFRNDQIKSSELKMAIEKMFYADQMQLPVGPAMTAFEVSKRFELLQRLLGPTMGRIETEKLRGITVRAFQMMYRKGAFKQPPEILLQKGAQVDVQYEGPLARSQRLSTVEGIEQTVNSVLQLASVNPAVLDVIDMDAAIREIAEVRGVPAYIIKDSQSVQRIRDARAKQQAERQQMADTAQMAESAGKAAPALQVLGGGRK